MSGRIVGRGEATARANESPAARLRGQRASGSLACAAALIVNGTSVDSPTTVTILRVIGARSASLSQPRHLAASSRVFSASMIATWHRRRGEGDRRNGTRAARIPARRGGGKEGTCGEMACDGNGGVACGCGVRIRAVHTSLSILGLRTKTTLPRSITEHAIRHMSAISASPT